ncbi:helix-turn-helix domain-containing protein [Streptomyces sp. NPDC049687]|uniref:helix-turn-helix domain-containing protein n=1 Tax=Streptomyces sp. NPDC049687 TaxID=3365596 RepID=UPI0037995A2A
MSYIAGLKQRFYRTSAADWAETASQDGGDAGIKSIGRAVAVLRALAGEREGLSLSQLAERAPSLDDSPAGLRLGGRGHAGCRLCYRSRPHRSRTGAIGRGRPPGDPRLAQAGDGAPCPGPRGNRRTRGPDAYDAPPPP